MFLIPLGLRAKLYIFPWATALLIALTVGFSIKKISDQNDYYKFLHEIQIRNDLPKLSYETIKKSCSSFFEKVTCDFIQRDLNAGDLLDLNSLNTKIISFESFDAEAKQTLIRFFYRLPTELESHEDELKAFPEYKKLIEAKSTIEAEFEIYAQKESLLTRDNIEWQSLLEAQFAHTNWVQLLGNMILLIIFSLYLEQRLGHIGYLVTYFFGGTMGLFFEAKLMTPHAILSGAFANVMTIAGAYTYFFYREELEMYVYIPFKVSRKIGVPAWFYVGFTVLVWGIFYTFSVGAGNFVFLSQVVGFLIGGVIAALTAQFSWLREGFLFEAEQLAFLKAKKTSQPRKKLKQALKILEINKTSYVAIDYIFRTLTKHNVEVSSLDQHTLAKISDIILRLIEGDFPLKTRHVVQTLSHVPLSWNLLDLPMYPLKKNHLKRIDNFLLEYDWKLAIRFYDLYAQQHPEATENLWGTIQKILVQKDGPLNPEFHQNIEWLNRYAIFHPHAPFAKRIKDKYAKIAAAS